MGVEQTIWEAHRIVFNTLPGKPERFQGSILILNSSHDFKDQIWFKVLK
jgi:hypothetical protein